MVLGSYVFSAITIIFSIFVIYQITMRYINIKNLDETNLKETEKRDYLKELRKYSIICTIALFVNVFLLIVKFLEIRLIGAVIVIILVSSIYSDLLDEIEDFDTTKKDSDILKEYFAMIKEDSKEKTKENKLKKIDSVDISKMETEKQKEEENKINN